MADWRTFSMWAGMFSGETFRKLSYWPAKEFSAPSSDMAEERTAWGPFREGRLGDVPRTANQGGILKLAWVSDAKELALPPTGWVGRISRGRRVIR